MSKLSTIIEQVKARIVFHNHNLDEASKDVLFKQAVQDLFDYQEFWDDFTIKEQDEANKLYAKYSRLLGSEL